MTLKKISPEQDAFGNLVRASFFADYMELLALKKHRNRKKLLSDYVSDTYSRSEQILTDGISAGNEDWDAADIVEQTWNCLEQRALILEDRYPFEISSTSVALRPGVDPENSPYIAILAIAINHAFSSSRDLIVENLFEDLVGDCLADQGLTVGRFGEIGRDRTLNFEQSMSLLGDHLGIAMRPNSEIRRSNAQDAGVDLVAHLDWKDSRSGRWLFIGQVTCARSEAWATKINDPVPELWMSFFGEQVPPIPFLALPYHVDDAALSFMNHHRRRILDRIRIVKSLSSVRPEAQEQIRHLLAAEMQTFTVA